jgi:hypothetical protein
MTSLDYV